MQTHIAMNKPAVKQFYDVACEFMMLLLNGRGVAVATTDDQHDYRTNAD